MKFQELAKPGQEEKSPLVIGETVRFGRNGAQRAREVGQVLEFSAEELRLVSPFDARVDIRLQLEDLTLLEVVPAFDVPAVLAAWEKTRPSKAPDIEAARIEDAPAEELPQ